MMEDFSSRKRVPDFFALAAFSEHRGVAGAVGFVFGGGLRFGADIFLEGVQFGEEFG